MKALDNLRDNYTVAASKSQADFNKRLADDWDIRLDAEFEALLCPQVDIEQTAFETSILREGCRDALIVWRGPRILVDGYHRYKFCAAHDIPFAVTEMDFTHRGEAREWIILNQLARRNLPMHERARLAIELKPIYEEKAKANLHLSEGRGKKGCQISDNVIDTKKELAKKEDQLNKKAIAEFNDDALISIADCIEYLVKKHCPIPSDFDFSAFETDLFKAISNKWDLKSVK